MIGTGVGPDNGEMERVTRLPGLYGPRSGADSEGPGSGADSESWDIEVGTGFMPANISVLKLRMADIRYPLSLCPYPLGLSLPDLIHLGPDPC